MTRINPHFKNLGASNTVSCAGHQHRVSFINLISVVQGAERCAVGLMAVALRSSSCVHQICIVTFIYPFCESSGWERFVIFSDHGGLLLFT